MTSDSLRHGELGARVPALRLDHAVPDVHGPAVPERGPGVGVVDARAGEHFLREPDGEFDDVFRASAGQHLHRFLDLDRVARGEAQRGVHVGQQGHRVDAGVLAQGHHGLGEFAGACLVLHEGAAADLDVQHQRTGAFGDLLAHDRGGDQRDGLHRAGDVPQGVELLVGRGQSGAGRADDRADVLQLGQHFLVAQCGAPARDRLELVQRAAGVAEAAAGELRHGNAEDRHQRSQRQGDLVPHPAGRVLVGRRLHAAVGAAQAGEVHPLAGGDHGRRPARNFGPVHAVEQDGHVQGGHLLVGDRAAGVRVDRPVNLGGAEHALVPLDADDVDGVERFGVAGGLCHRCSSRCWGPKASGRTWSMVLIPCVVMSSMSGARNS